jgi:hypothetical protein
MANATTFSRATFMDGAGGGPPPLPLPFVWFLGAPSCAHHFPVVSDSKLGNSVPKGLAGACPTVAPGIKDNTPKPVAVTFITSRRFIFFMSSHHLNFQYFS